MSVLKSLESKIAGLVEGTFSRAFRSEVRPVEIARKLAREMEEHRSQSLSRTYAPNEYRVFLSPPDRDRFTDIEGSLAAEFTGYLLEHARREQLVLLSRPVIHFETDDRLRLGEFGIQTSLVEHPRDDPGRDASPRRVADPDPEPIAAAGGRTMIYSTAGRVTGPLQERSRPHRPGALLLMDGRRMVVGADGATLGRSRSNDVMVDDPNVSRNHAEIRPHGASWVLTDLGSTNGVRLNGRRVTQPEVLRPGDELELGTTTLTFALE